MKHFEKSSRPHFWIELLPSRRAISCLCVGFLLGATTFALASCARPHEPSDSVAISVEGNTVQLGRSPVSVAEFRQYVNESGRLTQAEELGGGLVIQFPLGRWNIDPQANWQKPWGTTRPEYVTLETHPVTQVSWNDALAYCKWHGKRLPTVDEWILAAKAGNPDDARFAVGRSIKRDGHYLAKIWSGYFPIYNDGEAGEIGVAPVGTSGISPTGLTDMSGNVWNWMADDRIDQYAEDSDIQRALKGGSFLCDENVCRGYDIAARQSSTPDTSAVHIGFRCAR